MNRRQKLSYFWEYYKAPLIGIPLALLLVLFVVRSLSEDTEPALTVYLINQPVTEEARAAWEAELCASLLPADTDQRILVNASLTITPSAPDHESQVAFTTAISGRTVDLMIGDTEFFSYYAARDAFADLRDLLPEELADAYEPYFVYAEDSAGTSHAFGIDVSEFAPFDAVALHPSILTAARYTEHRQAALSFLRYCLTLQETAEESVSTVLSGSNLSSMTGSSQPSSAQT